MLQPIRTVVVLTVLLAASIAVAEDDKSPDLMKLQGEWVAAEGFEADVSMLIKDNRFTLKDGERSIDGTFKIDASKTPKSMDLTVTGGNSPEVEQFKDKISQAIYEVDGERFKWCAGEPGKDARPTEFARGDALYVIFKRKTSEE